MRKALECLSNVASCLLGILLAYTLIAPCWDNGRIIQIVSAQGASINQQKYVEVEPVQPYQAVRVIKVTIGTKEVIAGPFYPHREPTGVPFKAGDDWLKELTFTVKNRTSKKVVQLFTDVCFPNPLEARSVICQEVYLGRTPDIAAYMITGEKFDQGGKQPLDFLPGQEMTISFAPYTDELRRKIEEKEPFSAATRCFINVHYAYFEDGMSWLLSKFILPDTAHPGHQIDMDHSYFPGDLDADK